MTGTHRIEVDVPDISRWRAGNAGTEYVHVFESGVPGPVVMVNALTHGNEVTGAIAVDTLLARGLRPRRGTLILAFANVAAFARFNRAEPGSSRFVDEDFNRVWGRLDAGPDSTEMRRARALSDLVLGPAAKALTAKRLVIVAPGMLQYVPFAGLPIPTAAAASSSATSGGAAAAARARGDASSATAEGTSSRCTRADRARPRF